MIGRADWNDCLNLNAHSTDPDESFQTAPMRSSGRAESVMIGALFVLAARDFAALASALGDDAASTRYRSAAGEMSAAIEQHGWDGDWFLRAYDHAGEPVGSRGNVDGQIFLEPQALCAMAGIGGSAGLIDRALQSVAERLACDYGVQLLDPPYRSYRRELGEISTYLPGYKENGSVFCHTNPWVIIAEAMRGRSDRAMKYLRAIAPTYQSDPDRRDEPYVYAQMVAGMHASQPGEAKNSWLTGSASWSHVAVTQYILGIRATLDGLVVDPAFPPMARLQCAARFSRCEVPHRRRESAGGLSWGAQYDRRWHDARRQRHTAGETRKHGPRERRARLRTAAQVGCVLGPGHVTHGQRVRAA